MAPQILIDPQEPTLPALIAGRYRVVRRLGQGSMGAVMQVEDLRTGTQLALKLLHRPLAAHGEVLARFRTEGVVPARVASEHLVQMVYPDEAAEHERQPFLLMELLDGCDLKQALEAGPFNARETLWVLGQLARALDQAHKALVIHRDLKPQNLYLHRRNGGLMLKVLDFGIAKLLDGPVQTGVGQLLGTPHYMAPEQVQSGHVPIGPGTDQTAVALLAFRMLVGRLYWGELPPEAILAELHTNGLRALPSSRGSSLGPAFDQWFLRSGAHDPAARWRSMTEQCEALRRLLGVTQVEQAEAALLERVARYAPATPRHPQVAAATLVEGPEADAQPPDELHPAQFAKVVALGACGAAMLLLVVGSLVMNQCGKPVPGPTPKDMADPRKPAPDLGTVAKPASPGGDAGVEEPEEELEVAFRVIRPTHPRLRCGPKGQPKAWTSYKIGAVMLRPGWECRAEQKNFKPQTFRYEALQPHATEGKVTAKIELDPVVIPPF